MDFSRQRCASCSSYVFPGIRKDHLQQETSNVYPGRPISALQRNTTSCSQASASVRRPTSSSLLQLYDKKNSRGQLPPYFSFNDPHLRDFYLRKFYAIAQNDLLRIGILNTTKLSIHNKIKTRKTKLGFEHEARYTVSVTTGKQLSAGTSAKVFISLCGLKGKITKRHLVKKGNLDFYSFQRGKMQSFKFGGPDVGKLSYIIIEHDGVLEKDGWFLEEVEVIKRILKSGKSKHWTFCCNDWLSLHASDGLIKRKLFTKSYGSKPNSTFTEYQVVVVTGDVKGSGTDAHVFMTIFGTLGQTDKIHLTSSSNDFKKASTSNFNFKTRFVGSINKIRIEHDNTGFAPGWFLERVIVTDLSNAGKQYFFPCKQWLAKDEGDGATFKDLLASTDLSAITQKSKKYKILVYTGDKKGAGTDANVSIQLFGSVADSGIKMLDARFKNDFERNKMDEFTVESLDLGDMKRIRIGHDNSGPSPGWFLEKVEVVDDEKNKKYEFPCHRWLAKDEDDGETYRDLTCDKNKHGFPYEIRVKTGDVFNAGTSAKVFIVMYGGLKQDDDDDDESSSKENKIQKKRKNSSQGNGLKTSGKLWLTGCKFERNRTDVCRVEVMEDMSPLQKLEIGHDNKGLTPGWFLDEVTVCCLRSGTEQTFLCKKWLAVDEDDGIIERTLHENGRITREQKVTWSVRVHTCDEIGAGTDANVFMVLYGRENKKNRDKSDVTYLKSRDIQLNNKGNNFESGQVDVFVIEVEDVGSPTKLRVWHDNSKPFASWKLYKMELENHKTKENFTFMCNRWLSEDEDDKEIIRELPVGSDATDKVLRYKVFVHNGKILGAGTDANVSLCIYGENGDTGDRPLKHCLNNANKFERGQIDEFVIEAVDLKKLKRIRIGHDGKHAGSGWFLEKVVIQLLEDEGSNRATNFECSRWFDTKEDDGQIVRELVAGGIQMLNTTSYHISVRTGTCRQAGTDANVHIQLFGSLGSTGKLKLVDSESGNKNKFETGRVDLFKIEAVDIGEIRKIIVGHDGSGVGSGWFLEEVTVKVPSRGEIYEFPCGRWFDEKEDDGLLERELVPRRKSKNTDKCIPYCITLWTGDKSGAGTDANVFIQIYGDLGKSEEIQLRNNSDNFERGSKEVFKIEAIDVGKIFKIRIGHDGKGIFSGWLLHKILIQCFQPSKNKQKLRLQRTKNKNDMKFYDGGSHELTRSKKQKSLKVNFDDLSPLNKSRRKSSMQSKHFNSSLAYDDDDYYDEDDCYDIDDEELASVRRAYKEHQNRNSSSSEEISRSSNGEEEDSDKTSDEGDEVKEYWFICDKWFATNKGDGKIVRELLPTTAEGQLLRNSLHEIIYIVKVFTGNKFGAGTDANVFLKLFGSQGDSGEIHLRESNNTNKFEKKQVDIFKVSAIDLGILTKLHIRHDNKGGSAGWFLDHIEVEDTKNNLNYYFECKKWLAVDEGDGQLSRVLVPQTEGSNKQTVVLAKKNGISIEKQVGTAESQKIVCMDKLGAQTSVVITYRVMVFTGNKFGAGTDANVHIIIFGAKDDTGKILLKNSKSNKNKFERNQVDEFSVEAEDLGELRKIRIGHDNKGFGGAWFLDKVEIEIPSTKTKWIFPHSRWIAKEEDDGKLEHEILAQGYNES